MNRIKKTYRSIIDIFIYGPNSLANSTRLLPILSLMNVYFFLDNINKSVVSITWASYAYGSIAILNIVSSVFCFFVYKFLKRQEKYEKLDDKSMEDITQDHRKRKLNTLLENYEETES